MTWSEPGKSARLRSIENEPLGPSVRARPRQTTRRSWTNDDPPERDRRGLVDLELGLDRAVAGLELQARAWRRGRRRPRRGPRAGRRRRLLRRPRPHALGGRGGSGQQRRGRGRGAECGAGGASDRDCRRAAVRPAMGLSSPWSSVRPGAQAVALGPQRRLGAVGDAELAEDPRQVRLDRLLADLQPARDQLVRQALDAAGRAPRARARTAPPSGSGSARAVSTVRAARGSSGDSPRAAARMPSATSSAVDVLEQVAARAGLERAQDPRAVGERRQHEHRRARAGRRAIAARRLDPVERAACRGPSARRRARSSRARSTASSPSAATPTSSMSSQRLDQAAEAVADRRRGRRRCRTRITTRAPPARLSCPAPGAERTASVPSDWRDEVLEQRQPDVALLARGARARRASKPRPSSVTTRRVSRRSAPRDVDAHGVGLGVLLDVAQRLARDAVDQRVAARAGAAASSTCSSVSMPAASQRAEQVAERGLAARPTPGSAGGSRRAACAGRARPGAASSIDVAAARRPRCASPRALGVVGQRREAERDAGEVLHHAVVQVGGDPPALVLGGLDRAGRAAPRARGGRAAGARAIDHASGTWKSSSTSSAAEQRRRERAQQAAARSR